MEILNINGGRRLHGTVQIPASKNSALAILSSVLLSHETCIIHNVPQVTDIRHKLNLLELFGAKIETFNNGTSISIDCTKIHHHEADEENARPIRTSFFMMGPLLAKLGKAHLPAPGGCKLGARPVDFHLKGLSKLGADIELEKGAYTGKAIQLFGSDIYLDFPSAGATQHLMSTATLARGTTVIHNAAAEPEVLILADFLMSMGAKITGIGTSTITIIGTPYLRGTEFTIPSDRIQASTYMVAAAATCGDVTVENVIPDHLTALSTKLSEAGATVIEGTDWVRVKSDSRLKPIKIKTLPYPGFPTDVQQIITSALTVASGTSVIEETIYESRIGHIPELVRMGAKISLEGRLSIIEGVDKLKGAIVEASDLRAGAALCIAALISEKETIIKNVNFIDRGYQDLEQNLTQLGACIHRVPTSNWEYDHVCLK